MSRADWLTTRWTALAPREQALVGVAAAVIGVALLWWVGLAPALQTLRGAPAQHRTLDTQLQRMQVLQVQAQALQGQPKLGHDEALRALEQTIRQRFGTTARYSIGGDRVTINLSGAAPDTLAQWLTQARVNARALPAEARLVRNAVGQWDGTLVMTLPARQGQ